MTRAILVCAALFVLLGSATAQESKLHLLLNGGLSLPQNPEEFRDRWSRGFNVGGGVSYLLARHLTLQAVVNYDRFPFDKEGFVDYFEEETGFKPSDFMMSVETWGAEVSVLAVSGELKVLIVGDPNRVSPYVVGGGGIAHLSAGAPTFSFGPDPSLVLTPYDYLYGTNPFLDPCLLAIEQKREGETETKAMATVGGGVGIPLSPRYAIFVEGRYQLNFTSDERTNFVSLRAGVRISL